MKFAETDVYRSQSKVCYKSIYFFKQIEST